MTSRQMSPGAVWKAVLALDLGMLVGVSAVAAEPEPVAPGLWEVQMLALFEPDPQPGAKDWPGLPGKARARTYRICLDGPRARAPMKLSRVPPSAHRSSDNISVLVRDGEAVKPHEGPAMESLYRRLGEHEFEGSHTVASSESAMTVQYRSVFVQRDCGAVRPATMSKFGEP